MARLTFGHDSPQRALAALELGVVCGDIDCDVTTAAQSSLVSRLQSFAAGGVDDFADIELDLDDRTPFQRRVIARCRRIRRGTTLTYAELARQAGSPAAARAVGNVMAANRFPLIVPCHRVVGSAGSLGGYSARQGLRMKRRLLALEGVPLDKYR